MKVMVLIGAVINPDGSVTVSVKVSGESAKETAFLGFCAAVIAASGGDPASAIAKIRAEAGALGVALPA